MQGSALTWFSHPSMVSKNHVEEISIVPDKHSNTGGCIRVVSDADEGGSQHPIITERLSVFPKVGLHELNTQQRDSALSRYKEKKKTRRYYILHFTLIRIISEEDILVFRKY